MSLLSSVHDLKTLILSFHSVVAVETVEEERLRHVLRSVSDQLGMRLFEWSITRGLTRGGESAGVGRTTEPLRLLSHIGEVTVKAVYLLKDLSRHLDDATTARQFRETADRFSRRRSTMVLSGETVKLPAEIEHRAARYELALPGSEELRAILSTVVKSLKASSQLEVSLTRQEYEEIVRALSGMTLNQARQVIAYAILEDGKLDAEDIHGILERKAQVIRDGGLLEYFPVEDNRWQLGGFANLKRWLERARVGFSEEAQRLNLKPPRGILITGVQGCGKSLAAKFIARE